MNKAWVIIPAAGVGKRMQADLPKQYLKLQNKTILEHTLACFTSHDDIAGLIIVLHPDDPYWPELSIESTKPIHIVDGGKERADSVYNGLEFLMNQADTDYDSDFVLVHDAARPCLSKADIDKLLQVRESCVEQGAILAMPVRDTMKRESKGTIQHTVDREKLWHALTPQMFVIKQLYKALNSALNEDGDITDEASALEFVGKQPMLVEGQASNIKITRPDDLKLAEFFLQQKAEQ